MILQSFMEIQIYITIARQSVVCDNPLCFRCAKIIALGKADARDKAEISDTYLEDVL
jgi:hypothetical protein